MVCDMASPHTGVYFDFAPAMKVTIQRILNNLVDTDVSCELKLKIKFGFDWSGSHSIYNQVNNVQTNNIILTMFCPLAIENADGIKVWEQKFPNAPQSQRPLALQMGKESLDTLQTLKVFNNPIETLNTIGFMLPDLKANVKIEISNYMMGRKVANIYLGVGGAYCDLCSLSRDTCHNVDIVKQGINIDTRIETLHQIFEDLVQEDGTVLKQKEDYPVRRGVTSQPIATNQAFSVQILHALLRTFDHFMKTAVHVKAGVFDWSEAPSHNTRFLNNAKKELQEKIASETGIQWDIPDKTGKGGTTTTGNIARELLHSRRAQIISELPSNYQDIFSYYGQHLSVILRVMSSKEKVNVDLFKDFCTDLYVFLLTSFKRVIHTNQPGPWISITPTLHKVLAHS